MRKFRTVRDVAAWRLCTGCGICAAVCPEGSITMRDFPAFGRRPVVHHLLCRQCGECLSVCPGIHLKARTCPTGGLSSLSFSWGGVLEIWEGYAVDERIRFCGSSGGCVTAFSLFALETKQTEAILQIRENPDNPLENISMIHSRPEQVLSCMGSRYSPASPCEKIRDVLKREQNWFFVGKPCDNAAVRMYLEKQPELFEGAGCLISIFCAGTPSFEGVRAILNRFQVSEEDVSHLRFRGHGWPGKLCLFLKDQRRLELEYEEAWGNILSKYVPLRCRLCPDGTGEFADLSFGDAWYRKNPDGEKGFSLVLVRTEKGRCLLQEARQAGYLYLEQVREEVLARSQPYLLNKRRHLLGRLQTMKWMGCAVPVYEGFSLKAHWKQLSWRERIVCILGTLRRILQRKWMQPDRTLSASSWDWKETSLSRQGG